jgi:Transcription initiation factor IIA, gamma subunit, helical domain
MLQCRCRSFRPIVASTMSESFVQLYRSSLLCDLLTETLEELCEEAKVSEELAQKVLAVFDKSCLEALTQRAEAKGQLTVRIHCNMRVAQGPTPDRRLITKRVVCTVYATTKLRAT